MSRRVRFSAFALSCFAASLLPASAQAAIMNFDYETAFNATVDTIVVNKGRLTPYVDQDAFRGKLNGPFGLSISGSFDTDNVKIIDGVESVDADYTIGSDVFGTVFRSTSLTLTKAANGDFELSYHLDSVFYRADQLFQFDPTTLFAKSVGGYGTSTSNSLSQEGSYRLFGGKYENIYGTQQHFDVEGSPSSSEYFKYGADVARGSTPSAVAGFGSLTFELADPIIVDPGPLPGTGGGTPTPAVPEPATWAMMIVGLGFVGGAMRLSRRSDERFTAKVRKIART